MKKAAVILLLALAVSTTACGSKSDKEAAKTAKTVEVAEKETKETVEEIEDEEKTGSEVEETVETEEIEEALEVEEETKTQNNESTDTTQSSGSQSTSGSSGSSASSSGSQSSNSGSTTSNSGSNSSAGQSTQTQTTPEQPAQSQTTPEPEQPTQSQTTPELPPEELPDQGDFSQVEYPEESDLLTPEEAIAEELAACGVTNYKIINGGSAFIDYDGYVAYTPDGAQHNVWKGVDYGETSPYPIWLGGCGSTAVGPNWNPSMSLEQAAGYSW